MSLADGWSNSLDSLQPMTKADGGNQRKNRPIIGRLVVDLVTRPVLGHCPHDRRRKSINWDTSALNFKISPFTAAAFHPSHPATGPFSNSLRRRQVKAAPLFQFVELSAASLSSNKFVFS